ncbi:MAG: hypothetical protein GW808_06470 [Sphingomonadales bacterium]|nr:hypothetical protein [Sphingomonadales bacterium]NCO48970.1 hypothetical protein [Sphingomonadales bacterium]NCO98658.1 hypothetical protein [Sphingomonadales bacterium]NCP26042.1 hypothetical protein [Sphingomonadales bacterium]NCP44435.1 hypothetical protein [Sphingomonadales bacterium]
MSIFLIAILSASSFSPFPDFDSVAYCKSLDQHKSGIVAEINGDNCLVRESKTKLDANKLWSELAERDRSDCKTLASFGGGSYTVLMLCAVKAQTAFFTKAAALADDTPPDVVIENAPPCKQNKQKCAPWERNWGATSALQPNDVVTEDGKIYRMPY